MEPLTKKEQEACTNVQEEEKSVKRDWFQILALPSFLYALVYAICLYKNVAGITVLIWILATIIYVMFVMKRLEIRLKSDSYFQIAVMILLGISTFLTGNVYIIGMNYFGFFLMLVAWLLHHFEEDQNWDFSKHLLEIVRAVFGALGCLLEPLVEGCGFLKSKSGSKDRTVQRVILGIVLAIPLSFVLIGMLASADAVFESWLDSLVGTIIVPWNIVLFLALLTFGFFSSYCGMHYLGANQNTSRNHEIEKREPITVITITAIISLLYLVFSVIQIVYLFFGLGTLPNGMTYAEYARTGFFQLLFICLLNLGLVVTVKKYIQSHRILTTLLMIICGCTYVMIASSAYRMLLYIGAYHLTFLRIFVLVALAVISLIMAGVIITLFSERFPLFQYSVVVISFLYLCFSFAHIDAYIADYNLAHMTDTTKEETLSYIGTLSTDAAGVIHKYVELEDDPLVAEIVELLKEDQMYQAYDKYEDYGWLISYIHRNEYLTRNQGIRTFNLSYHLAKKIQW